MAEADRDTPRRVAAVADYLSRHGYRVATSVSLRGRSGASYDLDVLAEKSDDVTSFRMLVDCKSWDTPLDKQVLAGVHMAMTDLGINKAIVISAKGWRTATDAGAKRLGIELWGPVEVEGRIGGGGGPQEGPPGRGPVTGFPVSVAREQAEQVIRRQSRGVLGMGGEEVAWFRQYWLPFYRLKVRHSREDKERFRRPTLRTREFWNVYEGLSGSLYDQWEGEPGNAPVNPDRLIRPRLPGLQIVNEIEEAARRYNEAPSPEATARYEERLTGLGIELPVSFFDLSTPSEMYIPFYLALLRSRGAEHRIVAVDATNGAFSEDISRIAMMNIDHIVDSAAG
jgi:uncharacterized protein with GYD domain